MRQQLIDYVRGVAVVLMIIFHFCYDLDYFDFWPWEFNDHPFWYALPRLIATLFILCMGLAQTFSHPDPHLQHILWRKVFRRSLRLFLLASIISACTYWLFPSNWIYFGILHFAAVAGLLLPFFLPYPRVSLALGGLILLGFFIFPAVPLVLLGSALSWTQEISPLDYIPLYPWMGVALIGVGLSIWIKPTTVLPFTLRPRLLITLGQNSLIIYLFHQVVLFGVVWIVHRLISHT